MSRISIPRFILPKRIYKQIIFRFLCWRISYDFYLDSYKQIVEHNKGFISYPACWKENVGSRGCHACCCLMASLLESLFIVKNPVYRILCDKSMSHSKWPSITYTGMSSELTIPAAKDLTLASRSPLTSMRFQKKYLKLSSKRIRKHGSV